jgi:hypothetical protein
MSSTAEGEAAITTSALAATTPRGRRRARTDPPTVPGPTAGALRLATPCTSEDDFVARFARHVTASSVFIVTRAVVEVGLERPFVFELRDGMPVLQGRGRVVDVSDGERGRRRGLTLRFLELTDVSRRLHAAMLLANRSAAARAAHGPPPLPAPRLPGRPAPSERHASGTPVPFRTEPDAPDAPLVLPASALTDLVECTLHEDIEPQPVEETTWPGADPAREEPTTPAEPAPGAEEALAPARRSPWPVLALAAAVLGIAAGYGLAVARGAPLPALVVIPAPPPAAATRAAAPAAAAGPCTATVTASARDVEVRWNGALLGTAPLAAATVPCGRAEVALDHPRYQRAVLTADPSPGAPAVLDVVMERPAGILAVASRPPGATFTVDGAAVTGGQARVRAYSHVDVTATLAGHQPWRERVYVRGGGASIVAELVATPRPQPARRPVR